MIEHTDVWQNTTLCDCDGSQKFVQLLIVSDGKLQVTWDDTCLLVVSCGVSSQFQDLGSKVFEDSGEVDWSTSSDSLSVVTLSQESVNTTDWEGETGLGRSR